MFDKPKPFRGPPGSETTYEVRYRSGRKPFPDRAAADAFAAEQRSTPEGWAEVSQVIKIVVDKRR